MAEDDDRHLAALFNDACEKAKLILRELLPDISALGTDAVFTPRLMLVMLDRAEAKLAPPEHQRFADTLTFLEHYMHHQLSPEIDCAAHLESHRDALNALLLRAKTRTD